MVSIDPVRDETTSAPAGKVALITPELKAYCESQTPLARMGEPIDIGAMAVHLGRPESSFITGQVIAIDGGWTAQ